MKTPNFTPWAIRRYPRVTHAVTIITDTDEPEVVAEITADDVAVVEAHARLIAAAPAIYAAAMRALTWFDERHAELVDTADDDGTRDELSAALALVDSPDAETGAEIASRL